VHRPEVSPRRARGQKTAAVERREASVPRRADGVSYLRGDAWTCIKVRSQKGASQAPGACRRSASLTSCEGNQQTSEDILPRENDDARPNTPPSFRGRAQRGARNEYHLAAVYGFRLAAYTAPGMTKLKGQTAIAGAHPSPLDSVPIASPDARSAYVPRAFIDISQPARE